MKSYYLLLILLWISTPTWADVEGILNKAVIEREVTMQEVRDIYSFKERIGPKGTRPVVFRLTASNPTHREFVTHVLGVSPEQFERDWKKWVNAGLENYSRTAKSNGEMLDHVTLTQFGVGYIDKDYLAISLGKSEVIVVRIVP
jgi:hypothetical protein